MQKLKNTPATYQHGSSFSHDGFTRNPTLGTPEQTVLGDLRENPYTVQKMTEAYNLISPTPIQEVETTNLYVKFCPTDYEELRVLTALDLNLYDYPLEYEVLQMGKSYTDPNLGVDEIPCFYAIVEPRFTFPRGLTYEVLEKLHLADYASPLTQKAFELTDNEYVMVTCAEGLPGWPFCECELGNPTPEEYEACIICLLYTSPSPRDS